MNRPVSIILNAYLLFFASAAHANLNFDASELEKCKTCEVSLSNNELVIGNDLFQRKYLWNNGHIISTAIVDKTRNTELALNSIEADFGLKGEPLLKETQKGLSLEWVSDDTIQVAHLLITIRTSIGELDVMRKCKLIPTSPSLTCQIFLKGKLSKEIQEQIDHKVHQHKSMQMIENSKLGYAQTALAHIDQLNVTGNHWHAEAIEFFAATDYRDTLVQTQSIIGFRKPYSMKGNLLLLRNKIDQQRLFVLKFSPASDDQLNYPSFDFKLAQNKIGIYGSGINSQDISSHQWTALYATTIGIGGQQDLTLLKNIRSTMLNERQWLAQRDDMVLMNTWGDRAKDSRVNESFILNELTQAHMIGISHYQIDDGWQAGLSQNSANATGDNWKKWETEDWKPHPKRFPNGLAPIIEKANQNDIKIGLWFNPSSYQDYSLWRRDAQILIDLYHNFGIEVFKIDGIEIPNKVAERNLIAFFNKVREETSNKVLFNLDVTAGRRGGYFFTQQYGNIFLENRYTDWANYYPYKTLRNLWMLSKYVPPQHLQIEFLNPYRNADKYPANDPFAPVNIPFDYIFASIMMAQPLAWFEASGLPSDKLDISSTIKQYRKIQSQIHNGIILPIGDEPSGRSFTGFQSIQSEDSGYLLLLREDSKHDNELISTHLKAHSMYELTPIMGEGKQSLFKTDKYGNIAVNLKTKNSYALYHYALM